MKIVCVVHVVALRQRGAWMFAEMLIHFRFGTLLHHICPTFRESHAEIFRRTF